jgi:hypothetical protein
MADSAKFMNSIASGLDDILNPGQRGDQRKFGFALLVYEFDKPVSGRVNYVGNGKREDVLVAMKEVVARWEGNYAESAAKN